MAAVLTPVILKYDPDRPDVPWEVHEDLHYSDDRLHLTVEKGFHTDLTSTVRWLPWALLVLWPFGYFSIWPIVVIAAISNLTLLIRDPLGRHQIASIFHDAGYKQGYWKRPMIDSVYLHIMRICNVHWLRRWVNYIGVRIGGYWAWRKHRSGK